MAGIYKSGTVLEKRFEILNLFKSTNLTTSYIAIDRLTKKKVIVKCCTQKGGVDRKNRIKLQRLIIEAKILQSLNHPSVVRYVHSWGGQDDFHLATEYIEAKSMKEVVKNQSMNSRDVLIEYLLELLEVTEYLHCKGIIHRDIKPSNIMLGDNIVLLDFDASEAQFLDSRSGKAVMGTPGYQCPESFNGIVSPQYDIYSIGATLLFLLTGENPSGNLSGFENLTCHSDLLAIAFKAMDKKPMNRFRSASEMKQKIMKVSKPQTNLIIGSTQYPISKESTLIGRGTDADFKITDPQKFISPIHTEIRRIYGCFFVFNRSINGTYVYRGGEYHKIEKMELFDGDVIVMCYKPSRGPYRVAKFRRII